MSEFGEISKMIAEYTGQVDKSKRGLIWDDNPEVGDSIHITVIATGFKADISDITGNDYSKLIIINEDLSIPMTIFPSRARFRFLMRQA